MLTPLSPIYDDLLRLRQLLDQNTYKDDESDDDGPPYDSPHTSPCILEFGLSISPRIGFTADLTHLSQNGDHFMQLLCFLGVGLFLQWLERDPESTSQSLSCNQR
jgi:hypothetical protein